MSKGNKSKLLFTLLSNLIFAEILLGFKIGKKQEGFLCVCALFPHEDPVWKWRRLCS